MPASSDTDSCTRSWCATTVDGSEIGPNLAESWEVSADGTTYTFHLREGVKWSDGAPHSSEDFMFWYEDVLGDEDLAPSFPVWLTVGGEPVVMDAPDDLTIRFTFPGAHGIFMNLDGRGQRRFDDLVSQALL